MGPARPDILDFASMRIGTRVRLPHGEGQCVDLANDWLMTNAHRRIWANAVDFPKQGKAAGLTWVDNSSLNFPTPGDLVVWAPNIALGIPDEGHVAVCLIANAMHLLTLDQNWPTGSLVHVVAHSYGACLGWLRISV